MKILLLIFSLLSAGTLWGGVYHIETSGVDDPGRDGKSPQTAWKSLAYACERATPGDTLRLGVGEFVESRPCILSDGLAIIGKDSSLTRVKGSGNWALEGSPREVDKTRNSYIIVGSGKKNVTIGRIGFSSADTTHRLHGAIWYKSGDGLEISGCDFTEFFWNGVALLQTRNINLHHNRFFNAGNEKDQWTGGAILTKWISDSRIHHNTVTQTKGFSYGYKAQSAGHRNVKIHNNVFSGQYFSIESAHDQEYGLEIYENVLGGCVSVPKHEGGPTKLPEGFEYSVRIHHNLMHDSYGIEGPRNHMRIDSNYVFITKTGGRFYTQHQSSVSMGPVWIHHNVIVNVDRGLVWAHDAGKADNFHIHNNTVYLANAGDRTEAILAIPNRAKNWKFHNNIIVAAEDKPRRLFNVAAKGDTVATATHNVFVNVTGVPGGNWSDIEAGLMQGGNKPFPFYSVKDKSSFVVDKGLDLGMPFIGSAPDIGAYEFGAGTPSLTSVKPEYLRRLRHPQSLERFHFDVSGRLRGKMGGTTPLF